MAAQDLGAGNWERSKISTQDINLTKKLGLMKKKDALRFPSEDSYPTPPIEYRLHLLTPNSILHVSIFITLRECFLGVQPNWALWKRIFCLRRNGSHNIAYNIGGIVICVRPDVKYFDVKFPDSIQGWCKRWLYVHEECPNSMEYNVAPFDGGAEIIRRRSWDAEATEEEKMAAEALMTPIRELQNTRGKELSGIQITAYFLRIRVQPLQARKNPLWMYAGEKDVDRLSKDISVKDLEKLIRRISSLSKKDVVPSSCRVEPYSGTNALPKSYLRFLPFLKAEKSKKGPSSLTIHRALLALRAKLRRKRDEVADSGTSKADKSPLEEIPPEEEDRPFNPYDDALVSPGDEEEDLPVNVTAQTSTSRRMHQDFELEKPTGDHLLDAVSLLEIHGDEVRQSICDAKLAFSRLFPYFFAKKEKPETFATLARQFIPEEDLGLGLRHEGLKIGVEGTIALVADNQQNVDWQKLVTSRRWRRRGGGL
ncbi:hypothetical protein QYE76_016059 [Lolium multiflorum]|uniref:Transposase (putative) gypsy type domain-containing protein n=1 Tax=Lolium multiflorum TaxID=4521 RepID=A0AAD8X9R5_LOLMU|nr:hypothetical protein QYE76_016059 [Lolium multiflorum]